MIRRVVLDQLSRELSLSEGAIDAALTLGGARPDAAAWRAFAIRLMGAAGVAALGAGVVFFVAANWQHFGVLGRFILLQGAFVACVALAWWRPSPDIVGHAALVVAIFLIGGLLALFGQSYQTGADLFELFFAWTALALPFAFAARSGIVWAIWWSVLNAGLALYCGWLGPDHFMWRWLDGRGIGKPLVVLIPCAVNFGGAALFLHLRRTSPEEAPRWLLRMLTAIGFVYGTVACILAIGGREWTAGHETSAWQGLFVLAAFVAAAAVIAIGTLQARRDVFPMAAIIASAIAITTALLIKQMRLNDIGTVFVIAAWLIAASTGAGYVLMRWVRAWGVDEEASEASA